MEAEVGGMEAPVKIRDAKIEELAARAAKALGQAGIDPCYRVNDLNARRIAESVSYQGENGQDAERVMDRFARSSKERFHAMRRFLNRIGILALIAVAAMAGCTKESGSGKAPIGR